MHKVSNRALSSSLGTFKQFIRFGMIGALATATHYIVALVLFYLLEVSSIASNVCAYFVALAVSLLGQSLFTFKQAITGMLAFRFMLVSLLSAAITVVLTEFLTAALNLYFWLALGVTLFIVPIGTFVLQKYWVYR